MNAPKLMMLESPKPQAASLQKSRLFRAPLVASLIRKCLVVGLLLFAGVMVAQAASVKLTASDAGGTTSFNTAGNWNSGQAPSAGNNYFTTNFTLRTPNPTTSGNNYVFAGSSLSVDTGGRFLGKVGNNVSGNSTSDTITVANLILNGGVFDQADVTSDNAALTVAGNVTVNTASVLGAIGGTSTGSQYFDTLQFTAVISGSANLQIAGSAANSGQDTGLVIWSAANPYSGTLTVTNGNSGSTPVIASTLNGAFQLNNVNAVSNATLNLTAVVANPISFAAGVNTGPFNVGALTGNSTQSLADTAGSPVTLCVGGNNSSSAFSGALGGAGGLIKVGAGSLTLAGTNGFTGNTSVSNGTLALASTGSITNSSSITVGNGATFNVSSNAFTLVSGQSLFGYGQNQGSVVVASGANLYAGLDQTYGTNTFTANLTLLPDAAVHMDLGDSHNGSNDLFVVSGNLSLQDAVFHIKAPSTSDSLDSSDYTLITASGLISGRPASTPAWDVQPVNSGHYTVLTNANKVVLHYNASLIPQGSGSANPTAAVRNQSVLVTVTVSYSATPIASVTVDATALGGANNVPLHPDSSNPGNYTNSVVISPSVGAGTATLVATMTDTSSPPLSGTTPPFTLTVNVNSSETWDGGGTDNHWSTDLNWQGGFAPGYLGDTLDFGGTARLAPDMNANYSITDLTFDGTAGSFALGSSGGYVLTLTDGSINNYSANTQTLDLSISNSGNWISFNGGGNIVVSNGISGSGGLTNNSSAAVILAGTNTFAGGIVINSGTLQVAGAGLLGGTNGEYAGNITNFGVLQYSSSAVQTLSGVIYDAGNGLIKDGTGTLILAGANTYTGGTVISNDVLEVTGTLDGGNYSGNITLYNNSTLQWASASAQTLTGAISGAGGLVMDGLSTLTLNGSYTYSGPTTVNSGAVAFDPTIYAYPTMNSLVINGGGTVSVSANSGGGTLPVGDLALDTNGVLELIYNFSSGNPTVAAVSVMTNLFVSGTNVTIRVIGFGAATGQFPLISYAGTPLANLNQFTLILPPGVTGQLVNNTGNPSIDLDITGSTPATWVPLDAVDVAGTSSFTNSGNWENGQPPMSGYGYYTSTYTLRSPADSNSYTFGGSALSIDTYGIIANAGRFLLKGPGGATITITNLYLNGGLMDYANLDGDNGVETVAGNITLVGGLTSYLGALVSETEVITAPISGGGNLQIGGANVNTGQDVGVVALDAGNSYSGSTTVASGTLLANGANPNTSVTVLSGATLGGSGSISGPVTVQSGGTIAPGVTAQGALTSAIGTLTTGPLSVSGTIVMKINAGVSPDSDEIAASSLAIEPGATITVNNIGTATLAAGDTFQLFSGAVSGVFSLTNLPALPSTNLVWADNIAVNGTIEVTTVGSGPIVLTNSPKITQISLAGNNIVISGTNGQTGATAYLLATTNLSLPRNQWNVVATNVFTGNAYIFTETNVVTPGVPEEFYILSSTNNP